jgi:hypothetical protein
MEQVKFQTVKLRDCQKSRPSISEFVKKLFAHCVPENSGLSESGIPQRVSLLFSILNYAWGRSTLVNYF